MLSIPIGKILGSPLNTMNLQAVYHTYLLGLTKLVLAERSPSFSSLPEEKDFNCNIHTTRGAREREVGREREGERGRVLWVFPVINYGCTERVRWCI